MFNNLVKQIKKARLPFTKATRLSFLRPVVFRPILTAGLTLSILLYCKEYVYNGR
jgi:hypothetical protein